MRKHRLFGVVIAVLIGLGAFTHRSGTVHPLPGPLPGTDRAGMQLTSADLPAHGVDAVVPATVATDMSTSSHGPSLTLVAGHAVTVPSSPFGPAGPLWDFHFALLNERAAVIAYLGVMAQRQAMAVAYLDAAAAHRAPSPVTAARPAPAAPAPVVRDPWTALRQCESAGNYRTNTGNGYYGAYQFTLGTWRSLGLGGLPSQATAAQQDRAAQELQARRGWSQWPSCARNLGLD